MIAPDQIPRDANGLPAGAWRIVHENPAYTGPIGVYDLVGGESTRPAFGRLLLCAVGEYGGSIYLEPWGPSVPPGTVFPEAFQAHVPQSVIDALPKCPWRAAKATGTPAEAARGQGDPGEPGQATEPGDEAAEAVSQGIEAMGRDDLIALAELHEIPIDRRWGETKLRRALAEAGITGV